MFGNPFFGRYYGDTYFGPGSSVAPPLPPVADFVGDPLSGNAPLEVAFTDLSTNTPTSWLWDFGDGHTSTEQNPTHVYDLPGDYTVTLTATNAGGSDDEVKVAYVSLVAAPHDGGGDWLGPAWTEIRKRKTDKAKAELRKLKRRRDVEAALAIMLME